MRVGGHDGWMLNNLNSVDVEEERRVVSEKWQVLICSLAGLVRVKAVRVRTL